MQLFENVSLRDYTTMRIGGEARYLTIVDTKEQLAEAVQQAGQKQLRLLVLGGGSNIIARDEGFDGLVVINRIMGFEVLTDDPKSTTIRVGAGENWDSVVARTVEKELHGIEMLSAIPGTAGGTPVQNVGAYGAEIADTFVELEAYDLTTHQFVRLGKNDCQFSYRHSIFKSMEDRRYIIANITLKLSKEQPKPPFYDSLQRYLDEHHITHYTPQTIREAVIAIRAIKLPDPSVQPNTGSFFKNPIVERYVLEDIQKRYADVPYYDMPSGKVKIPAGWLLDMAGFKGFAEHGMKVYDKNALVFVNESANRYSELEAFRDDIRRKIYSEFHILLVQEPELI